MSKTLDIRRTFEIYPLNYNDYYWKVEDLNVEVGTPGITVSYLEGDKVLSRMTFDNETALAIAEGMIELLSHKM